MWMVLNIIYLVTAYCHLRLHLTPPKCQALACLRATVHSVPFSLECLSLLLYQEKSVLPCSTHIINPQEGCRFILLVPTHTRHPPAHDYHVTV